MLCFVGMRSSAFVAAAVVLVASLASCTAPSDANAIKGGVPRYTVTLPDSPGLTDGDGGVIVEGSSISFTDLYTEYLGPGGRGSCTGNSTCHSSDGEAGAQASGFVCNADKAKCRATLLSSSLGMVIPGSPDSSYLVSIIRHKKASGGIEGRMPKTPFTYTFTNTGMTRIRGWIAAGAKDD